MRYVLEGSVQRSGDKVRIRAQLIDGETDHHLWAGSYDGVMKDIFDLQDKITGRIVFALAVKLSASEQKKIADKGTDNVLAYEAFLKGMGGDEICLLREQYGGGLKSCEAIYRNPEGDELAKADYFRVTDYGFFLFSVEK